MAIRQGKYCVGDFVPRTRLVNKAFALIREVDVGPCVIEEAPAPVGDGLYAGPRRDAGSCAFGEREAVAVGAVPDGSLGVRRRADVVRKPRVSEASQRNVCGVAPRGNDDAFGGNYVGGARRIRRAYGRDEPVVRTRGEGRHSGIHVNGDAVRGDGACGCHCVAAACEISRHRKAAWIETGSRGKGFAEKDAERFEPVEFGR